MDELMLTAVQSTMYFVNKAHKHEIFMESWLDLENLELTFDMPNSFLEHAIDLARLFNMTYSPVVDGDKIKHRIVL